ncbi:carboxylic ester hydrolase [Agromyces rhizosphaerae]|uniref:Carboxylic ester hydrolase n=1 Tax=Agromyces rhizosphaerae TaxID=88374 RepID=A0A9W6FNK9_9MICO|nr:carboxylesterase family protein [Agromyces rhizosphaerae]GLI26611.1 carboxylic ester hydrolase [Agromyces rhizosphaerae]
MIERTDPTEVQGERVDVDTPLGAFPAMADGDVVRIRNIRYARAARFAKPDPVAPDPAESADLQQVRLAFPQAEGPRASLVGFPMRGCTFDEDALRLSITRPRQVADAPLPVLVWLHGGSYAWGAGDITGHDAGPMVREQGVIVVTVTSRIGLLGFVADESRPANLGLLDVIAALRWVRRHIAAFGGDPDRVTVFGQSSGADTLAHVLAADGTEGLVTRAILQSAPLGIRGGREQMHERMLRAAGPLDADTPVADLLAAQERAKEAAAGDGLRSAMAFAPQYGRAPLPAEDELEDRWRERAAGLDVLVTWTTEESAFFFEADPKLTALAERPVVGQMLRDLVIRFLNRAVYSRDGRRLARLLGRAGARAQVAELSLRPDDSPVGAAHAIEVPLLFPGGPWTDAPLLRPEGGRTAAEAGAPLRAAWAEFAREGRIDAAQIAAGPGWSGEVRVGEA